MFWRDLGKKACPGMETLKDLAWGGVIEVKVFILVAGILKFESVTNVTEWKVERGNGRVELGMSLALMSMVLLLQLLGTETLDESLLEMLVNCFRLDVESGITSVCSFEEETLT